METKVGYQIILSLSMQMFGLGLAGLAYRYIVEPPQMVRVLPMTRERKFAESSRYGLQLLQTLRCLKLCTVRQTRSQMGGVFLDTSFSSMCSLVASFGTGFQASFLPD
jgi:hypothetical protein